VKSLRINVLAKKFQSISSYLLIGVLFFSSCHQEDLQNINVAIESDSELISLVGKKLENPYSVSNMQKAYKSLLTKKSRISSVNESDSNVNDTFDIKLTDLYVKFLIKSDDDLQVIINDSLNYSILPLDYEILAKGEIELKNKDLDNDGYWIYTSVKKNYIFNNEIKYKVLDELFLPESIVEENEPAGRRGDKVSSNLLFLEELEDESLLLTGNLDEREKRNPFLTKARVNSRPQGYIRVENTTTKTIDPVIGVKVKTRRWFKWASGYTDNNGFYSVDNTYERDVHYEIVFKNSLGFKIWPSMISVSSGRYSFGKHSSAGHNITFSVNSKGWRYSTVNNATVQYLNYCRQFNVGLPHSDLRIVAMDGIGSSSAPMLRRVWGLIGFTTNSELITFLSKASALTFGVNTLQIITKLIQPDLIIYAASSLGTASIFSTTFHELAHASHMKQAGSAYWIKYINYIITYGPYGDGSGRNNGVCAVGEMWGFYYGYFLTLQHFGNNNNNPIIRPVALENFMPVNRPNNSDIVRNRINGIIINMEGWIPVGIVHDLIDNNVDVVRPGFTDNVNGYTVGQIFGALRPGVETVQGFRNRLLQNNGNNQQQAVNDLFNAYFYN
jgi:hypothetical protein